MTAPRPVNPTTTQATPPTPTTPPVPASTLESSPAESAESAESAAVSKSAQSMFGGWKFLLRAVAIDALPPLLLLALLSALGVPDVIAYTAGAGIPLMRLIIGQLRGQPFNVTSALVVVFIAASIVLAVTTQDVRAVMARGALVYLIITVIFGASLLTKRPMMFLFTNYYARKAHPANGSILDQRYRTNPTFRNAMRTTTAVWAAGMLAVAAVCATAAYTLPLAPAAIINNVLEPVCALGLALWSRHHLMRRGMADVPLTQPPTPTN